MRNAFHRRLSRATEPQINGSGISRHGEHRHQHLPADGLDEQTLTKNADIAMYQAKAEGKNNFQFYSEKLNVSSLGRLTLESSLRHALEHNEFTLHYVRRVCSPGETG
jgi:hypothetical protein